MRAPLFPRNDAILSIYGLVGDVFYYIDAGGLKRYRRLLLRRLVRMRRVPGRGSARSHDLPSSPFSRRGGLLVATLAPRPHTLCLWRRPIRWFHQGRLTQQQACKSDNVLTISDEYMHTKKKLTLYPLSPGLSLSTVCSSGNEKVTWIVNTAFKYNLFHCFLSLPRQVRVWAL